MIARYPQPDHCGDCASLHIDEDGVPLCLRLTVPMGEGCTLLARLADDRTPCEVWTRVMGYHRPVHAFNAGKRAEHADRWHFTEAAAAGAMGTARG